MVENLFSIDDGVWKNFWYDTVVPKFYSYALGSAVGLNRFLMLANLIQPQMNVSQSSEDVTNRQVTNPNPYRINQNFQSPPTTKLMIQETLDVQSQAFLLTR